MTARRLTRLATLGVLAGLALTPTAAAYAAPAPSSAGHAPAVHAAGKDKHPAPKPRPAPVKPKPVRLVQVTGVVTAVDPAAGTLAVRPAGPRQPAVTLAVAATVPVQKDEAVATLADVAVGDHVSAKASLVGTVLTAVRLEVESPEAADHA